MKISFSPPDIKEDEINAVVRVLKSGWITTGPETKAFEEDLAKYCKADKAVCVSSATAGMELILKLFGVGQGDEVITSPYTFASTANIILHCGATPVFADIDEKFGNINVKKVEELISEKTKAIIPVDFAGLPCDYKELYEIIERKKSLFKAQKGTLQEDLGRVLLLSDAAHSFGSTYDGKKTGALADFTVFSFHAVKNLTTAEGGAILFSAQSGIDIDEIEKKLRLFSLHGQSKSAFDKMQVGGWFYEIKEAGYKYNMSDLHAAIGRSQLKRYSGMDQRRKEIFKAYNEAFKKVEDFIIPILETGLKESNAHLYPLHLKDCSKRNAFIQKMGEKGISCNVHFIPLPMQPLYKNLGYDINNYPAAERFFETEVSLPIYPTLKEEELNYIIESAIEIIKNF